MPIPKKMFQTARSLDALPNDFKYNISKMRERNPDWDYNFFDDTEMKGYLRDNLTAEEWNEVEQVNPKYGVLLADLFRYLIILNEGGIYLDVKSTAQVPLSAVIDRELAFVISQWPNKLGERFCGYGLHPELVHVPGGEFQQWAIIGEQGHPFLKAALKQTLYNIKTYTPNQFGTDAYGVLRVSGPIAYTKAIYPIIDHFPHKVARLEDFGIKYSIYEDSKDIQRHSKLPGHYSSIKEPVVLREVYVEAKSPIIVKLGDLLARELRENVDLVLKLAVFSLFFTLTLLAVVAVATIWILTRI